MNTKQGHSIWPVTAVTQGSCKRKKRTKKKNHKMYLQMIIFMCKLSTPLWRKIKMQSVWQQKYSGLHLLNWFYSAGLSRGIVHSNMTHKKSPYNPSVIHHLLNFMHWQNNKGTAERNSGCSMKHMEYTVHAKHSIDINSSNKILRSSLNKQGPSNHITH